MMRVDMQIALGHEIDIDQAVPCYLFQHVFEERQARFDATFAAAVEIHRNGDPGLLGVA